MTAALAAAVTLGAAAALGATALVGCDAAGHRPGGGSSPTRYPTDLPGGSAPERSAPPDGRSRPVADPVYPEHGNPAIDVMHYDLALRWEPSILMLTGTATIELRVVTRLTEITLDFSDAYGVDGASVDGTVVGATWDRGRLVLPTGQPRDPDALVTVVVRYHGTPREAAFPGARTDVPAIGLHTDDTGAIWAMQEPYGAFTWFPCSDQPSDKAMFDVAVTAPSGWTGVSSGTPEPPTTAADGSTTTRWHGGSPSATYLVALAVDRFERFAEVGPHGLPVTYWMRREDAERMLPLVRKTPAMLDWLERHFGRYPFASAGVVVVPDHSAMETQTMVTMGPLAGFRGETVLLHELSHQWFGDTVTPSTWRDLWLNEGMATYAEMMYTVEHLGGSEQRTVRGWRDADAGDRATAGPPGRYLPDHFADHNVYQAPALMLHEIRARVGDLRFFAMLRDWPQQHLDATADRATFERWAAEYTGQDLGQLIDAWLDSPTTPRR